MDFLYTKSLHIIFVVTWFAGLFYIVRLFIYHKEAEVKDEKTRLILQTQYKLMEKRLWYIITWPSAILTALTASYMLYLQPYFLEQKWMWVKLSFVGTLFIYHFVCHKLYIQLQNNICKYSTFQLRLFNEIPTIILFAVVFLVVLKSSISWIWGVGGIISFGILLMLMVRLYKKLRTQNNWDKKNEST